MLDCHIFARSVHFLNIMVHVGNCCIGGPLFTHTQNLMHKLISLFNLTENYIYVCVCVFVKLLSRVFVERPEGKRPLGRYKSRWEDNIKLDLQEVG